MSKITVQDNSCIIENQEFPAIGFGTYRLQDKVCIHAVEDAIQAGYRIIDTATLYSNLSSVGKAIKGKKRHDLYVISKVWPDKHHAKDLKKDLQFNLEQLETDYLDCYFLHWPNSQIPIEETLGAMDEQRKKGLIRHIGLSNVTVNHLKRAMEVQVPIHWVQVEMHTQYYDKKLLEFCLENEIAVQAWRPLNLGHLDKDNLLEDIGKKYFKTVYQVALRWIVQNGCVPLPGSKNKEHIEQNFDIFDFVLSPDKMTKINKKAAAGERYRLKGTLGLGFADEFDLTYEECWPK